MKSTKEGEFLWSLACIAAVGVSVLVEAVILARLWTWFVVPLGLPHIGIAHASGLSLCVMLFQRPSRRRDGDEPMRDVFSRVVGEALGRYGCAILFGYALHEAMATR